MTSNLEEEVNAYYKAKESYTELLYKSITDSALEKDPGDSHNPPPNSDRSENWFTHRTPNHIANIRPDIDVATIIEMSKAARDQDKDKDKVEPEPSKTKEKSKAKR